MVLAIKTLITFVLIVPATVLTIIIWLFGGWTRGWDYMPNPVYGLITWGEH